MDFFDWIVIIIALSLAIFAWWALLPASVYLFSPSRIRCYFETEPNSSLDLIHIPPVERLLSRLERLGFSQIGVRVEKTPLWKRDIVELSLSSQDLLAFASLSYYSQKTIYYYFTPFDNRGVVLTSNAPFPTVNEFDLIQTFIPSRDCKKVLDVHRQHVQYLMERGYTPLDEYTKETRITATYHYYQLPSIKRGMRKVGATNFSVFILVNCVFIWLIISRLI